MSAIVQRLPSQEGKPPLHVVPGPKIVVLKVWEVPVRLTHWLIAGSIVVLAATGFYIGHPFVIASGEARMRFVMGTVRLVHLWAAAVFAVSVLARIAWMFLGNRFARWNQFLPVSRERLAGIIPTIRFYLINLRRPPPAVGHNPVAGMAYLAIFGLYLLEIVTGLAMWGVWHGGWMAPITNAAAWFGGLATIRWVHHVVMWLLLGFVIQHVYSSVLMSSIEKEGTMDSIFTGRKYVHEDQLKPGDQPERA